MIVQEVMLIASCRQERQERLRALHQDVLRQAKALQDIVAIATKCRLSHVHAVGSYVYVTFDRLLDCSILCCVPARKILRQPITIILDLPHDFRRELTLNPAILVR